MRLLNMQKTYNYYIYTSTVFSYLHFQTLRYYGEHVGWHCMEIENNKFQYIYA